MTKEKGKDGNFAFEGGNAHFHHEGLYGTHEGDKKEGSKAPDIHVRRSIGETALPTDAAERWLSKKTIPNIAKEEIGMAKERGPLHQSEMSRDDGGLGLHTENLYDQNDTPGGERYDLRTGKSFDNSSQTLGQLGLDHFTDVNGIEEGADDEPITPHVKDSWSRNKKHPEKFSA